MRIDINEFYRYISLLENKCYNQQQKIEELQKEVERLKDEDRQIIFELSDEQYLTLSKQGLEDIEDSAEEFDGFLGGCVIGTVSDIVKENAKLKEQVKELEEVLRGWITCNYSESQNIDRTKEVLMNGKLTK